MQYRRCKCGSAERWDTGEAVRPCQGCAKCGTTFAQREADHRPLAPHQWEPRYDPKTGGPARPVCGVCGARDWAWERVA